MSNVYKGMKKFKEGNSIKRTTAIWYTQLYLIIALAVLSMLSVSILSISYSDVYNSTNEIESKLEKILSNNQYIDAIEYNEYLKNEFIILEKAYDNCNLAIVNQSGNYYFIGNNADIEKYLQTLDSNILFRTIPKLSLLNKGYLVSTRNITQNNNSVYKLLVFYPNLPLINHFATIILSIALVLTFGAALILILGRMQLGKVLSPINKMNKTTREITTQNLDVRLDVNSAEYELKELAQTTNEMIDSFQDAYERQEHFVSDVSHELRTPISVISGYANMLKRWGSEDKEILDESVNSIIYEAENMKNMVNRLLFLVKHDKRNLTYNMETMDLSILADTIIKDYSVANPEIEIKGFIEKNILVKGDEFRIMEVMRIFIDNAIKYTLGDNVKLEIHLQKEENNAILSVKDNGIGMKDKDLKNVFDRFYRSDKSRNKETGGMGLGLSIAKAIIIDHGGKIVVKTKENSGSEFMIHLPLAE